MHSTRRHGVLSLISPGLTAAQSSGGFFTQSARLVRLHGGELGVVAGGDALVAEDAPDLEHALQTAHNQPLQRQLCRALESSSQLSAAQTVWYERQGFGAGHSPDINTRF